MQRGFGFLSGQLIDFAPTPLDLSFQFGFVFVIEGKRGMNLR
jgi:hypothetical protein